MAVNETVHTFHLVSLAVLALSVVLFYYFFEVRTDDGTASPRSSTSIMAHMMGLGIAPRPAVDRLSGICPQCGTENDPAYTYCRECARRLAASP